MDFRHKSIDVPISTLKLYGKDDIVFSGVTFKGEGEQTLVRVHGRRSTTVRTFMSSVEGDYNPVTEGNVTIGVNDIGIREKK